jgi:GxxExxY protein
MSVAKPVDPSLSSLSSVKKNRGSWAKSLVVVGGCTRISNEEWILRAYLSALPLKYIGTKGPGLFESIYQWCLENELDLRSLSFLSQKTVTVHYKGFTREEPLRFDILVEGSVLVEAKSVAKVLPIHKAQLLSYMKLLNVPVGLLLNFNEIRLVDGVHRLILPGASRQQGPKQKKDFYRR